MHNTLALDQEATSLIYGASHPDGDGGLVPVCNSNMVKGRITQRNAVGTRSSSLGGVRRRIGRPM